MKKKSVNEKRNQRYIDNLEKYKEQSLDASKYSLERFDILIISLSTTALILSIGFVKDLFPDFKNVDTTYLKLSWLLFASTLILNLISQVTGYFSNELDIKVTTNLIRQERKKKVQINIKTTEKKMERLSIITMILNGICLTFLISGVIILVFFISNNI